MVLALVAEASVQTGDATVSVAGAVGATLVELATGVELTATEGAAALGYAVTDPVSIPNVEVTMRTTTTAASAPPIHFADTAGTFLSGIKTPRAGREPVAPFAEVQGGPRDALCEGAG